MQNTRQTLVGVFDTLAEAERAQSNLLNAGFPKSDIHVDSHVGAGRSEHFEARPADEGFMASISNFFRDLFDQDGDYYTEAVRRGAAVVSVTADAPRVEVARLSLAEAGAIDINKRADLWRQGGFSGYDASSRPFSAEEVLAERGRVIPVVKEELSVGKRQVDTGTVRVVSKTMAHPVARDVRLESQTASIERRPVDRVATAADLKSMGAETAVEVRETAERPVVTKSARVVEEVVVGVEREVETQTIRDTLRSNVVEVDKAPAR